MVSICIPIFNHDVRALALALAEQAASIEPKVEILLLDDGSEKTFRELNSRLHPQAIVRYEELDRNVGRSRIRNMLARKASHPYLLFLDCDVLLPSELFLQRYLDVMHGSPVVVGGHIYGPPPSDEQYRLHWMAGTRREVKGAGQRNDKPYHSFMTSNFLVHKTVFQSIQFREDLQGYGHEDTLFGFDLMKKGIQVSHTDNPVLHQGLEAAEDFLAKTREGLKNLEHTFRLIGNDPDYLDGVTILRTYKTMRSLGLCKPLRQLFRFSEKAMEKKLLGPKPSLTVFDLYKLAFLCRIMGRS